MKTFATLTLITALSICAFSQDGKSPRKGPIPDEVRAKMLNQSGGFIKQPASGPKFLFLSTQKRIAIEKFVSAPQQIESITRLAVAVKTKDPIDPMKDATEALKDRKETAAVLIICDVQDYPSLLIAPESRWAILNVGALAVDKPSDEVLLGRLNKELWRAFAFLMGAANSSFPGCVMKNVDKASDLDDIKASSFSPEPLPKIMSQGKLFGISPSRTTTYRKACEEGWAPMPTNEIQKAVWEDTKQKKTEKK